MQPNNHTKDKIAIAELKKDVGFLKDTFDKFLLNDFKHLEAKVDQLNRNLVIGAIVLIVSQIILKIFG